MNWLIAEGAVLVDESHRLLQQAGREREAMTGLYAGLERIRRAARPENWRAIGRYCLRHPLRELVHRDPLLERAYIKPRRYAGDAVMMDMIYGHPSVEHELARVSAIGREIHAFTVELPACRAVRARRILLAQLLDKVADEVRSPRVLALAAGHLREAELSRAVSEGRLGRYVALDQDRDSLRVVEERLGSRGVETMCESVAGMLKGRSGPAGDGLDLIYAAGLFDYLTDPVAARLTEILFEWLRPAGQLLIANFNPDTACAGLMEAFCEWRLLYRSPGDLEALSAVLPAHRVGSRSIYSDEMRHLAYLEVRNRG
jgi:hypothetical protein